MLTDYESWGMSEAYQATICVLEAYSGTAIVQWHGNIERQIIDKVDKAEKNRNTPYADKLREFLKIWRANEITGSINREQLDVLSAACAVLSVDPWSLANYFSNLRDQVRKLIAAAEQLPALDPDAPDPTAMGGGGVGPPGTSDQAGPSDFGPEEQGPDMDANGNPKPPGPGKMGGPADEFDMDSAVKNAVKDKTK